MADHRAVTAAREGHDRGDQILQIGLTITGGVIPTKHAMVRAEPDDIGPVLNAVAAEGWELVTGQLDRDPANPQILGMIYLFRRKG